MNDLRIRRAAVTDLPAVWPIFRAIVRAGDTYAYPRDCTRADARRIWFDAPRETWLAETDDAMLGSYYIKTNQQGGGAHVCNCGYMVAADARGQGVAAAMCAHSQQRALELGYLAMQFNFVVATNEGAIRLWKRMGFDVVGRLPRAFAHPEAGLVDALVMYKWLAGG